MGGKKLQKLAIIENSNETKKKKLQETTKFAYLEAKRLSLKAKLLHFKEKRMKQKMLAQDLNAVQHLQVSQTLLLAIHLKLIHLKELINFIRAGDNFNRSNYLGEIYL